MNSPGRAWRRSCRRKGRRRGNRLPRRQVFRRAASSPVKFCQAMSSFVKAFLDIDLSNVKDLRLMALTFGPSPKRLAARLPSLCAGTSPRTETHINSRRAVREEIVSRRTRLFGQTKMCAARVSTLGLYNLRASCPAQLCRASTPSRRRQSRRFPAAEPRRWPGQARP